MLSRKLIFAAWFDSNEQNYANARSGGRTYVKTGWPVLPKSTHVRPATRTGNAASVLCSGVLVKVPQTVN